MAPGSIQNLGHLFRQFLLMLSWVMRLHHHVAMLEKEGGGIKRKRKRRGRGKERRNLCRHRSVWLRKEKVNDAHVT